MLEITVDVEPKPGLKVENGTILYSLPWDGDNMWCVQWDSGGWEKVKVMVGGDDADED